MSDTFERAVRDAMRIDYGNGFFDGVGAMVAADPDRMVKQIDEYATENAPRVAVELRAALRSDALDELARQSQSAGAYDKPATAKEPTE